MEKSPTMLIMCTVEVYIFETAEHRTNDPAIRPPMQRGARGGGRPASTGAGVEVARGEEGCRLVPLHSSQGY